MHQVDTCFGVGRGVGGKGRIPISVLIRKKDLKILLILIKIVATILNFMRDLAPHELFNNIF